ncbi:MAG: PQQ-dependent sugar dehydrogenase [bacterium]
MHAGVAIALFLVAAACAVAQGTGNDSRAGVRDTSSDGNTAVRAVPVARGLSRPWSIAFLPDGQALVTERTGRLLRLDLDGSGEPEEVTGLPSIAVSGQGGLLDVTPAPDFESTREIFFSYVRRRDEGLGTAVARATLEGTSLSDVETIFVMEGAASGTIHFGSRLAFLPDDTLLVTIGDRGDRDNAQDLGHHAGSTIRISRDGSAPSDNPFVDTSGALPEIFSYGHRNAQGMTLHPETGAIWQHEHGPQGGDEVNVVRAGRNYGWPVISYGDEYGSGEPVGEGTSKSGMEQPLLHWSPSIAPSGMTFYTGPHVPEWQGDLFVGALAGQHLRRVELDGTEVIDQEVLFRNTLGRIRDVAQGPDGYLYLIVDSGNATLYRLEPEE